MTYKIFFYGDVDHPCEAEDLLSLECELPGVYLLDYDHGNEQRYLCVEHKNEAQREGLAE